MGIDQPHCCWDVRLGKRGKKWGIFDKNFRTHGQDSFCQTDFVYVRGNVEVQMSVSRSEIKIGHVKSEGDTTFQNGFWLIRPHCDLPVKGKSSFISCFVKDGSRSWRMSYDSLFIFSLLISIGFSHTLFSSLPNLCVVPLVLVPSHFNTRLRKVCEDGAQVR